MLITILLIIFETIILIMQTITIKIIMIFTLQMYLDECTFQKLLCLSSVLLIFPRALSGLIAAHLNQQVVVTGGQDGSNSRDEVLCGILYSDYVIDFLFSGAPVRC